MPSVSQYQTPSLSTFLKSLKSTSNAQVEASIENLIALLKRRQIRNSRPCALATAQLLLRVVAAGRIRDAQQLIDRVRDVGRRLVAAQPREMAVGNIVRRVLGVIREVIEEEEGTGSSRGSGDASGATTPVPGEAKRPRLPTNFSSLSPLGQQGAMPQVFQSMPRTPPTSSPPQMVSPESSLVLEPGRRPPLPTSTSYAGQGGPQASSLLSLLEQPLGSSPAGTPPMGTQSPSTRPPPPPSKQQVHQGEKIDLKAEVIDGIKDLLDELEICDTQIAESALDHIHSNETILTTTSSQTIQKFMLAAARKRKFTVVHAEAYPNDHEATHATIVNGGKKGVGDGGGEDERWKPLTEMGITVILIPDTAVFALMSRINKVLLSPQAVLANGSLIASAGTSTIALAAQSHHVPVVVLSGIYKLSPVYPFDTQELIEYGDPGKVAPFEDGEFMDKVDVANPLFDHVPADCVDLYVTNLGACAPGFLYKWIDDHYPREDVDLGGGGGGGGGRKN